MAAISSIEWRKVGKEIAIIVVGVLIALFAQQWADNLEWRHKVALADEAMQAELWGDDGPQMVQRAAMAPCIKDTLDRIRAAAETSEDRAAIGREIDRYWVDVRTWDMLAFDAAVSSDVASHMDPDRFELFALLYQRMPMMERTNAQEAVDWARMQAFRRHGGPISGAERDQVIAAVEALRVANRTMAISSVSRAGRMIPIRPINKEGIDAFLDEAREHYGACITTPDLGPR